MYDKKFLEFFKNKKIFITGHTGFKGSWLSSSLLCLGAKIMGYSKSDEKISSYKIICDYNKIQNIYSNILNYKFLEKKIIKFNPEIIFHLAAQSLVSKSYEDPYETIRTNIIGTLNIMEISRQVSNLKSLVIITSDKCYLNQEQKKGYIENDELGGEDPYSASKASAEIIFNAYSKSFFYTQSKFGYATARAGNVIGGGDWARDRIIPDSIKSILSKKILILRNPGATRPWQHVLEPISGYLLLSKKLYENKKKYSGSWNFGPSSREVMKVNLVVKLLFKFLNIQKKIKIVKSKFKESNLLKLNSKKASKVLNWKINWNMRNSIKQTALWYDSYMKKKNMNNFTKKQIKKYFKIYD
jgi:CDP-glucose 4,6-dehydratase